MTKQCNHKFIYSHSEKIANTTTDFREYDVLICEKCGQIRRFEKSLSFNNGFFYDKAKSERPISEFQNNKKELYL